ncbi:hypothetical protein LCGC14_0676370 [marine sediment metagenome]|uniref:Uncharacterized protein n=2 Tax=root TaxID=1 RepID=A0A831QUG2_9FLAO|nr:hypothetical protein [Pricia antarctica]
MKNSAVFKVVMFLFGIGLLSGCASTKLLGGNYSGQSIYDHPNLYTAPPTGDRLSWIGPSHNPNSSSNGLSVVNDSTLMYLITHEQWDQQSRLGFHSKPETLDTGWYTVHWTMKMRGGGPGYSPKPINIRITSGTNYQNWMFDMVLWPDFDSVGYTKEYGSADPNTFQQVRPHVRGRQMEGHLNYREDIQVIFYVNITTREYYINLPGIINGQPGSYGEIAPASLDLSASPTLWFSYGEKVRGGRSMNISNVSIYRANNEDEMKK